MIEGVHEALQDAALLGVTVCCATGDFGSADMDAGWDKELHVNFPASDGLVLACGGTELIAANGKIVSERVWNEGREGGAGGGGVSNLFARPPYQAKSRVPKSPKNKIGRGVPDLAGNAASSTGYRLVLRGKNRVIGGTSAVAPLMAGLIARINQRLGKSVGFINPLLYGVASKAFRDITEGNNDIEGKRKGKYTAGSGWDACTGLGVPDGQKLLACLRG